MQVRSVTVYLSENPTLFSPQLAQTRHAFCMTAPSVRTHTPTFVDRQTLSGVTRSGSSSTKSRIYRLQKGSGLASGVLPHYQYDTAASTKTQSVPSSSSKNVTKITRKTNSAPINKDKQMLPQIKTVSNRNANNKQLPANANKIFLPLTDSNWKAAPAGFSSKPADGSSDKKFATHWAEARVFHITRSHREDTKSPQHRSQNITLNNSVLTQSSSGEDKKVRIVLPDDSTSTSDNKERKVSPEKRDSISRKVSYLEKEKKRLLGKLTKEKIILVNKLKENKNTENEPFTNTEAYKVYLNMPLRENSSKQKDNKDSSNKENTNGENTNKYVPPWERKENVLNKKEAAYYRRIHSVYGDETKKFRKKRQSEFFKRLEDVQLREWEEDHKEYESQVHLREESKREQQRQLRRLRDRFEADQVKRFRSQYVTSKVLEHEVESRHVYGLPETYSDTVREPVKLRPRLKRPPSHVNPKDLRRKISKKYSKLFVEPRVPKLDPYNKPPLMEGVDYIIVDSEKGNSAGTKVDVKALVKEAKMMTHKDNEEEDGDSLAEEPVLERGYTVEELTERLGLDPDLFSLDSQSSNSQDVFQKAITKYGISIDSD